MFKYVIKEQQNDNLNKRVSRCLPALKRFDEVGFRTLF